MRQLLERLYNAIRRFFMQREALFSPDRLPPQHGYSAEQRYTSPHYREADEYPVPPHEYPPQGTMYQQTGYPYPQQHYPQPGGVFPQQGYGQRRGMSPWVAGGLGALGGGLAGYGIGQAVGEVQEHIPDNPLGEFDGGEMLADTMGFGGGNEDFGGGDFGGE